MDRTKSTLTHTSAVRSLSLVCERQQRNGQGNHNKSKEKKQQNNNIQDQQTNGGEHKKWGEKKDNADIGRQKDNDATRK